MPSPEHQYYQKYVLEWFQLHKNCPDIAPALERYAEAALVLWHLDLGPALAILKRGYAKYHRGGDPWIYLTMLRCLLLAILVGQTSLNKWVDDLKGSRVLRVLAGVMMDPKGKRGGSPGVGTVYDFLHRLHDGASRRPCPHGVRPSDAQRRSARTPKVLRREPEPEQEQQKPDKAKRRRKRKKDPDKRRKKASANSPIAAGATAKLVEVLKESQTLPNPTDLLTRLAQLLLELGVKESAKRGLLGDPEELLICGDGSPLPTGANRYGQRTCECSKREKCHCPRRYSDPDADIGYDSHRELYFFGHHIYEYVVSTKAGHDLPLFVRLDPASTSDYLASLNALERLRKMLRDDCPQMEIVAVILDAGHDGKAVYRFIIHHHMTPVIPLRGDAPGTHPTRHELKLSTRGVPLCPAGVEMSYRGNNGKGGQVFGCPVKAKKLDRCPQAKDGAVCFTCRPVQELGHTVVVNSSDDPRLFPPIPRNDTKYRKLMNLRSGCERSFSVKKKRFKLLEARHRRASFWLIRVHLMAVLQHALAWVSKEKAADLVDHLLGREVERPAA